MILLYLFNMLLQSAVNKVWILKINERYLI